MNADPNAANVNVAHPDSPGVICFNGTRIANKRVAMFLECLQRDGYTVRLLAFPRHRWVLDKSEQPLDVRGTGRWSARIGTPHRRGICAVFCFHWLVLPAALLWSVWYRVPLIYDEHDFYEMNSLEGTGGRWKTRLSSLAVHWTHLFCLPWVTLTTCIHMAGGVLQEHLRRMTRNVLEMHNYPSVVWRDSAQPQPADQPLSFVYIGGVWREKGVGASAEAFLALPAELREKSELHIFGTGDAELIRWLRAQSGIVVHNEIVPQDFRKFVQGRRCVGLAVLAGTPRFLLYGTNCTKLYEYFALGMPVIGTRVGEFPQHIEAAGLGLLIDEKLSSAQLCDAMATLVNAPELCAEMSMRALTLMRQPDMTWEAEWAKVKATGLLPKQAASLPAGSDSSYAC